MMSKALVLQSDFGISDGAVSAMYGVAYSVSPLIRIFDLTHDIPPYNIWEASYRLLQTVSYWPEGTVFVSVVDPGVGSVRKSVVAKTIDHKYIITPDNGTLTHLQEVLGIVEVRQLDETINRLPRSGHSYTFHGRDIYAYTGARLAAGVIQFDGVGPPMELGDIVNLPLTHPEQKAGIVKGVVEILDVRFGNLWTNIPRYLFEEAGIHYGDRLHVTIGQPNHQVYNNTMIFGRSFAATSINEPIVYINSLDNGAIAINQGSFSQAYRVGTGSNWSVTLKKVQ
ncbi:SAM hydrolase/SAM-dependent halogenase family protein [Priestia koreensis]|nr:S-adenosyl-l-methionine hydroxide adenosyltransferase family protein [Priestia koreensis]